MAIAPLYASVDFHDYYYPVQPAFATATRPASNARAGYRGSRVTFTASRRFPGFWSGTFARYDDLSGAIFANSPLVPKHDSFMADIGIAWILAESERP